MDVLPSVFEYLVAERGQVSCASVLHRTESCFEVAARLNGGCDVEPPLP